MLFGITKGLFGQRLDDLGTGVPGYGTIPLFLFYRNGVRTES